MAFVIVQHLDPHHASRLSNLLGKVTAMPVSEVTGTTTPKPNTVYVQPPNKCVIAKDGTLTLVQREERLNVGIDHFFESLAEECGSRAIGIVLSGTGSDGTAGLRAIKAAGGLTFAQNQESAKFDAMPRSAIRAGFVDLALTPRERADVAHVAMNLVTAVPLHEKSFQSRGRDVLFDRTRINSQARMFDHRLAQIGAENLDAHFGRTAAKRFQNANGERINFFAACAARHPRAQLRLSTFAFVFEQRRQETFLQRTEQCFVSKKARHVDEQI
ncbi:MAG: hypothetical protein DMC60_11745, partial [Verrucomicrobia bacterium]